MEIPNTFDKLISKSGSTSISQFRSAKTKALYFSASWCTPCRKFSRILAEFYKKVNNGQKELEIIFVSDDASEDDFNNYYKDMPWLAIPFDETRIIEDLQEAYQIEGLPALVIVNENWEVLSLSGYKDVCKNQKKPSKLLKFWEELDRKKETKEPQKAMGDSSSENAVKRKIKSKCFVWC